MTGDRTKREVEQRMEKTERERDIQRRIGEVVMESTEKRKFYKKDFHDDRRRERYQARHYIRYKIYNGKEYII